MTTNEQAAVAEARLMTAFLESGVPVAIPFGVARYDLIIDHPTHGLLRVQCKAGRIRNGTVVFNAYSMVGRRSTGFAKSGYAGAADVFAVWCAENATAYLVPIESASVTETILRLEPARNGQHRGVRFAADYTLDAWVASDSNRDPTP